jgi:hypothetical protein
MKWKMKEVQGISEFKQDGWWEYEMQGMGDMHRPVPVSDPRDVEWMAEETARQYTLAEPAASLAHFPVFVPLRFLNWKCQAVDELVGW